MRVYRTTVSFVCQQVQLGHMLIAYLITFRMPKRSKTIDFGHSSHSVLHRAHLKSSPRKTQYSSNNFSASTAAADTRRSGLVKAPSRPTQGSTSLWMTEVRCNVAMRKNDGLCNWLNELSVNARCLFTWPSYRKAASSILKIYFLSRL